jgi:SAM-dependent methyltransferase
MADTDHRDFWEGLYADGRDRWELGTAAPPLAERLRTLDLTSLSLAPLGGPGRAIVPGCGRGHEVLLLAELGWDAVGIDFAEAPLLDARAAAAQRGLAPSFVQGDWFAAADRPGWRGSFDLVVEHTCYCAIDPSRRRDYVDTAADVLRPGGRLIGLLWQCGAEGGPPWDTTPDDARRNFGRWFTIERLEPAVGSLERRGGEWLLEAVRR